MSERNALMSEDFFFLSQSSELSDELSQESLDLDEVEKSTIRKAINKHNGNISKAAKELGLTRASLYRRLEKHGL
jgi:transcriptional regulator of acetoin/glycerol metabolism